MPILIAISFAWTVSCWFTEMRTAFLGIGLLSTDAWIPALVTLALVIVTIVFWIKKGGYMKLIAWLREAWRPGRGTLALTAILVAHLAIQIPFILLPRGANDWDSALWGLAGHHIATGEERPVFGYGWDRGHGETQHYNGTIVSHVAAGLELLLGPSPVWLRLVNALVWCLFIIALYLLVKRLFDIQTALAAAFLAAIPAVSVFVLTHYSEYPQLALFGILSFHCVRRLSEVEKIKARYFFWWGITLGIGFYAIPHMLVFIITGIAALAWRRPKAFLTTAAMALPTGAAIGGLPVLIDAFYSVGQPFVALVRGAEPDFFTRLFNGIVETVRLLPWYLGGSYAISPGTGEEIVSPLPVLLIGVLACILYLYVNRRALLTAHRGGPVGGELFVLLALAAVGAFVFGGFSTPPAPYRYLFPLWPALILFIVQPVCALLAKRRPWAAVPLAAIALFNIVGILYFDLVNAVRKESYLANVETWLRHEGVTRFNANFAIVYPIAYATNEELIGSAGWFWHYEACPKYRRLTAAEPFNAWFFMPQERDTAREFIAALRERGVTYATRRSDLGLLVRDVDPPRLAPPPLMR